MAEAIIRRQKMTDEERRIARSESSKKWYHANKEKAKAAHNLWLENNRESTRVSHKKWLAANSEKVKLYAKKRYWEDPEKFRSIAKAWFAENRARARTKTNAWRVANPEKFKAIMNSWRQANTERCRVYDARRRGRKLNNGGKLSVGLAEKLFKLQRGKCACCGAALGESYHLDHIMPLSKGGANDDSNMQLLTKQCNQQKHARDPIDFMRMRGFLL